MWIVGASTYRLLYDLCSPIDPGEKTFAKLCVVMETYFTPPIVVYRERKSFYAALRCVDESASDWLVRISSLASNCRFGSSLEVMVVDKFVTGQDGRNFERICEEEEDLTIVKAMQLSLKYESHAQPESINFVNRSPHHRHHQQRPQQTDQSN